MRLSVAVVFRSGKVDIRFESTGVDWPKLSALGLERL